MTNAAERAAAQKCAPTSLPGLGVGFADVQMLPGSGCQSAIFLESGKKSAVALVRQSFSAKSRLLVRNAG